MIVLGADTHKRSHTVAAVAAGAGELLGGQTIQVGQRGFDALLRWARGLDGERVWALEDCRHVSGSLERFLIARGERVLRIPTHLSATARRSSRQRGKSDPIDALTVARVALQEGLESFPAAHLAGPELDLRLLVDHRERLVRQRVALNSTLQWHLHDLWPAGAGGDRRNARGAGQLGRSGEALGAGDLADEFGCRQWPEPGLGEQLRRDLGHELSDLALERLDRLGELADAPQLVAGDADTHRLLRAREAPGDPGRPAAVEQRAAGQLELGAPRPKMRLSGCPSLSHCLAFTTSTSGSPAMCSRISLRRDTRRWRTAAGGGRRKSVRSADATLRAAVSSEAGIANCWGACSASSGRRRV